MPHVSGRPRVSVILPVFNAERTILASVSGILEQSFDDFELIIVDDASTDGTSSLLSRLKDTRLRVSRLPQNGGISVALNAGLAQAAGELIARQDADDVSLPARLARQVAFLDTHPDHALVGTWSEIWRADGPTGRNHRPPTGNGELQYSLLFDSYFVHPSVMMRRSALDRPDAYSVDPLLSPPEDYELWVRIARRHKIANLPEALIRYYEMPGGISRSRAATIAENGMRIAAANLASLLGSRFSQAEIVALVRALRKAHGGAPFMPPWRRLEQVLAAARDALSLRWPDDGSEIEKAYQTFRNRLRRNRRTWPADWLVGRAFGQASARGGA